MTITLERETFAQNERAPQWYNLGALVHDNASTSEMLVAGGLADWNVRLEPTVNFGRCAFKQFDVVRDNPVDKQADTIGRVGKTYKVFQNEELFAFGDNLVGMGNQWEAVGSLNYGARVFGAMRLKNDIQLGLDDLIERHLIVHSSHDGSSTISASIVPLRYRCTNSLNFGLRHAKQTFKIRHSGTMEGRVQEAREVLGLANAYFDEFSVQMNKLIDDKITDDEAFAIIERAYAQPDAEKAGALTRWTNKVDQILDIYMGETCDNIYGTAWGIVNAMTERLDWYRTGQHGDMTSIHEAASGFDDRITAEKNRILQAAMR